MLLSGGEREKNMSVQEFSSNLAFQPNYPLAEMSPNFICLWFQFPNVVP